MESDKLKKWMDAAQKFQSETFWNNIFDTPKKNASTPFSPIMVTEYIPKCDLYESENKLIVEAEIPGLMRENLHISMQQQLLTITGEFKSLRQNCKYYLKERINRKFKKELSLPYPISIHQVNTEIRHGILYIIMPINQEEVENIPISFD